MTETQTNSGSATDLTGDGTHASPHAPTDAGPADPAGLMSSTGLPPTDTATSDPWATTSTTFDEDTGEEVQEPPRDYSGIRVPNVSAGAVSGLSHEPIGANVQQASSMNDGLTDLQAQPWSEDAWVAWVKEGRTHTEAGERADVAWESRPDDLTDEQEHALGARLTGAVYGDDAQDGENVYADGAGADGTAGPEHTPPANPTPEQQAAADASTAAPETTEPDVTQGGGGGQEDSAGREGSEGDTSGSEE